MKKAPIKAPFVVVDGLDGSGKTTQLNFLRRRTDEEGQACIFTREPGGAPLSEALRDLIKSDLGGGASALTQSLMFWASRREYLEKIVWRANDEGVAVFSDRGDSSTLAYQIYVKQAHELENEFWRMRSLVFGDRTPDLYVFIDVTPEIAYARTHTEERKGEMSHFDAENIEFYNRVHQGYNAFREEVPNVVVVDGTRTPAEIHEEIYRVVAKTCGW